MRFPEKVRDRLLALKDKMDFSSMADVVQFLMVNQPESIEPVTVKKIMKGRIPVVLTGKPDIGKTIFIRICLLPKLNPVPVLVIDTWNEYKEVKRVHYEIHAFDFKHFNGHIRFVPSERTDIAVREIERLFEDLDMKRRGELKRWVIIVEEANAYNHLPAFRKFLFGSKRIVRKMIVVTAQLDAFQGLETFIMRGD